MKTNKSLVIMLLFLLAIWFYKPELTHAQVSGDFVLNADGYVYYMDSDNHDREGLMVGYSWNLDPGTPKIPVQQAFLRFTVNSSLSDLVGDDTILRLTFKNKALQSFNIGLYEASDTWNETTLNWSTKPTIGDLITEVTVTSSSPATTDFSAPNLADYINQHIESSDKEISFALVFTICNTCIDADNVVYYEKDGYETGDIATILPTEGPTGITLASFSGFPYWNGVALNWQTASELSLAGFSLYRSETLNGVRVPVMTGIGPQLPGTVEGASYQWFDLGLVPFKTYYYWLEVLSIDGSSDIVDPVSITAHQMIFLPLISH